MSAWDWEEMAYEEEVEYAYAEERERELEEKYDAEQTARMQRFDEQLDAYQERERELAAEREELSNQEAVRPDAERLTVTFGDLAVGDFMTAEDGPTARWVKVVAVESRRKFSAEKALDWVTITFQTPQPLGVAYTDRWVIERERIAPVVIDGSVR